MKKRVTRFLTVLSVIALLVVTLSATALAYSFPAVGVPSTGGVSEYYNTGVVPYYPSAYENDSKYAAVGTSTWYDSHSGIDNYWTASDSGQYSASGPYNSGGGTYISGTQYYVGTLTLDSYTIASLTLTSGTHTITADLGVPIYVNGATVDVTGSGNEIYLSNGTLNVSANTTVFGNGSGIGDINISNGATVTTNGTFDAITTANNSDHIVVNGNTYTTSMRYGSNLQETITVNSGYTLTATVDLPNGKTLVADGAGNISSVYAHYVSTTPGGALVQSGGGTVYAYGVLASAKGTVYVKDTLEIQGRSDGACTAIGNGGSLLFSGSDDVGNNGSETYYVQGTFDNLNTGSGAQATQPTTSNNLLVTGTASGHTTKGAQLYGGGSGNNVTIYGGTATVSGTNGVTTAGQSGLPNATTGTATVNLIGSATGAAINNGTMNFNTGAYLSGDVNVGDGYGTADAKANINTAIGNVETKANATVKSDGTMDVNAALTGYVNNSGVVNVNTGGSISSEVNGQGFSCTVKLPKLNNYTTTRVSAMGTFYETKGLLQTTGLSSSHDLLIYHASSFTVFNEDTEAYDVYTASVLGQDFSAAEGAPSSLYVYGGTLNVSGSFESVMVAGHTDGQTDYSAAVTANGAVTISNSTAAYGLKVSAGSFTSGDAYSFSATASKANSCGVQVTGGYASIAKNTSISGTNHGVCVTGDTYTTITGGTITGGEIGLYVNSTSTTASTFTDQTLLKCGNSEAASGYAVHIVAGTVNITDCTKITTEDIFAHIVYIQGGTLTVTGGSIQPVSSNTDNVAVYQTGGTANLLEDIYILSYNISNTIYVEGTSSVLNIGDSDVTSLIPNIDAKSDVGINIYAGTVNLYTGTIDLYSHYKWINETYYHSDGQYGVYVDTVNAQFNQSGGTISLSTSAPYYSSYPIYGVYMATGKPSTANGFNMSGGTINLSSVGTAYGVSCLTDGSIADLSGGTINVEAVGSSGTVYGCYANSGDINVTGTAINVTGITGANQYIYGLYAYTNNADITVSGTASINVDAKGTATAYAYGGYAQAGDITMSGGTLTVDTTTDANLYGLYAAYGTIGFSGGSATVTGATARNDNVYGVYNDGYQDEGSYGGLAYISDGTINVNRNSCNGTVVGFYAKSNEIASDFVAESNITGGEIVVNGNFGYGVLLPHDVAANGTAVSFTNGFITLNGANCIGVNVEAGVFSMGSPAQTSMTGSTSPVIRTSGVSDHSSNTGVYCNGGVANIYAGDIALLGSQSNGIYVMSGYTHILVNAATPAVTAEESNVLNVSAIQASGSASSVGLQVVGGSFEVRGRGSVFTGSQYGLYVGSGYSTVSDPAPISGGTYIGKNGASMMYDKAGAHVSDLLLSNHYVRDGASFKEGYTKHSDGTYALNAASTSVLSKGESPAVIKTAATVTDAEWELRYALEHLNTYTTYQMPCDITLDAYSSTHGIGEVDGDIVVKDASCTLELNGKILKNLSSDATQQVISVPVKASLTVNDNAAVGKAVNGTIQNTVTGKDGIRNEGKLYLDSSNVIADGNAIYNNGLLNLNQLSGYVYITGDIYGVNIDGATSLITVYQNVDIAGDVNILGGEMTVMGGIFQDALSVSGGKVTFIGSSSGSYGTVNGSTTISGGTLNVQYGVFNTVTKNASSTITLHGGAYKAITNSYNALLLNDMIPSNHFVLKAVTDSPDTFVSAKETSVAAAENTTYTIIYAPTGIKAALDADETNTVTLYNDIDLSSSACESIGYSYNVAGTTSSASFACGTVHGLLTVTQGTHTFDLNGFDVTSSTSGIFSITGGSLSIKGAGTVQTTKSAKDAITQSAGTLIIESTSKFLKLRSPDVSGSPVILGTSVGLSTTGGSTYLGEGSAYSSISITGSRTLKDLIASGCTFRDANGYEANTAVIATGAALIGGTTERSGSKKSADATGTTGTFAANFTVTARNVFELTVSVNSGSVSPEANTYYYLKNAQSAAFTYSGEDKLTATLNIRKGDAITNVWSSAASGDYTKTNDMYQYYINAMDQDYTIALAFSAPSMGGLSVTSYTVSFETNDGSAVTSQTVSDGSKVTQPDSPTKTDNIFAGWFTDSDLLTAYDFNTSVTSNFTLFAKWSQHKCAAFTDIDGHWAQESICFVAEKDLLTGITKTTFAPDDNMSRAMLVAVLYRLEGKPAVTGTNSFADVADGTWYSDAAIWASQNNIVSGYDNGLFGTNDNVTREQLAAILYRYAAFKTYDIAQTTDLSQFSDTGNISDWAQAAVKWAVAESLISGTSDNTLSPASNATRAEVAAILTRFITNVAGQAT